MDFTKKPPTLVTTIRFDMRSAATIMQFLRENEEYPHTAGMLARTAVEYLAEQITRANPGMRWESTDKAMYFLRKCGISNPFKKTAKNHRTLVQQLELEDMKLDGFDAKKMMSDNRACYDKDMKTSILEALPGAVKIQEKREESLTKRDDDFYNELGAVAKQGKEEEE